MISNEKIIDDLTRNLVRTVIVLNLESFFAQAAAEVVAESGILGSVSAKYFKNAERKIAETAYAVFNAAELTVEKLVFSGAWRRSNPEQNDLLATEEDDRDGKKD